MKVAVVESYNNINYIDIPEPEIRPGHVKVAVRCCGICGSDIPRVLKGTCHSFPQVLGHEFSGVVVEKAEDVKTVSSGDHVVGIPLVPCFECEDCKKGHFSQCRNYSFVGSRQQGAMAEYVVIPEKNVLKIDTSIPFEYAALFEPSTIALHGLFLNGYHPGRDDFVVILGGAGCIGLFTTQWCKLLGASNLVVIGRDRHRLEIAKQYGADNILSSLDNDFISKAIGLTGGKGFSYVFDAAGTEDTISTGLLLAANNSNMCMIGTPTIQVAFPVKTWEMINRKEMMLTGSWMSYSAPWPGKEWTMTAEAVSNGRLKIDENMIHSIVSLRDVKECFKLIEHNPSSIKGRIILRIE